MKFLELFNVKIPVSNEEKDLYKKILKKGEVDENSLNIREKFLIKSLLSKNLVNYRFEKENLLYFVRSVSKEGLKK